MIQEIRQLALSEIETANTLSEIELLKVKYLGRRGKLTEILSKIKDLPPDKKVKIGKEANQLKAELEAIFEGKEKELNISAAAKKEWIDVSHPGKKLPRGHLHPRTIVLRKVEEIFQSIGFSVVEGPELETDFYNFEALNIPKDHPARDMQDTFYINEENVLRTHTSPVQVRYMQQRRPPLRIIVPGRAFRREATDASHDFQFHQIEGLMVDKDISVANLKYVILDFFNRFFGRKVNIRLRPSFFPFTEPSFEIDMVCIVCGGKGCSVCSRTGWLEMAGAGMVHPFVFKSAGYRPGEWQGFAFGLGLERIVMMKYKITDIRLFSSGDLKFLKQF